MIAIIPLISAMAIWYLTPVPMISFTKLHGRSIAAFHAEDSRVYLSHGKVNDFTKGILTKPFGQTSVGSISNWPCPDCGRGYHLIPLVDGRVAAMVYRGSGLTRACREADFILTRQAPKYPCKAGLVISDDDLDRHGGVLIYQGHPPKKNWRVLAIKQDSHFQLIQANKPRQSALDLHTVRAENAGFINGIGRFKGNAFPFFAQAF